MLISCGICKFKDILGSIISFYPSYFNLICRKESSIVQELFTKNPETNISKSTILTPNIIEFKRLWKSLFDEEYEPIYDLVDLHNSLEDDIGQLDPEEVISKDIMKISSKLNGTVILKVNLNNQIIL